MGNVQDHISNRPSSKFLFEKYLGIMAKAILWVVTLNAGQKIGVSSLNSMEPWNALKKIKSMTMLDLGRKLDMKKDLMDSTFRMKSFSVYLLKWGKL